MTFDPKVVGSEKSIAHTLTAIFGIHMFGTPIFIITHSQQQCRSKRIGLEIKNKNIVKKILSRLLN